MKKYKVNFSDVKQGMHIGKIALNGESEVLTVVKAEERHYIFRDKDGNDTDIKLLWPGMDAKSTFLCEDAFYCCDSEALSDLYKDCLENMLKEHKEVLQQGICAKEGILEEYDKMNTVPENKAEVNFVEGPLPASKPVQTLANALIPEEVIQMNYFSVLMFFRRCEIEDTDSKEWVLTRKRRFPDHKSALNCYANTPCPASQLICAATEEELEAKENEMIENYKNEAWLEENLYPCL